MKKNRKYEANTMIGYDDKGTICEYHWQKEPYKVRYSSFISRLPWYKRFNPFWKGNNYTFKQFAKKVNIL